jgi:ribonuclease J
MTSLTFYGGVNEIGGNKFLIEDRDTKIFLDFGMSFSQVGKYYAEFLQPRTCNGLGDLMELGIIPDIKGIYRNDLLANEGRPLTEKPIVDAVFLSHAHADHSWHVSLLHPDIPIFCGATAKLILQASQETSKGTYYTDFFFYRENFVNRFRKPKEERKYKTFRTGDKIKIKDVEVEPIHVDHSIPGAYGFLVHTSEGCIAYSGDLRFHGRRRSMTRHFIEACKTNKPIAMLLEGTNIDDRIGSLSERQVYNKIQKFVSSTKKLCVVNFPLRDVDRLNTFFKAAKRSGRRMVVNMKQAYLIDLLNKEDKRLKMRSLDEFDVFINRTSWGRYEEKDYYNWQRPFLKRDNAVKAEEVSKKQNNFLVFIDFFTLKELLDIRPSLGSSFIYSMTEPFNEEMEIDFGRMMNWLEKFKMNMRQAHASGHANGKQLKKIAEFVKPDKLFPIHTDKPEMFKKIIKEKIILPELGKSYKF